ncbi:MAG: glutathione S-transferase [Bdellovibrionota bacterium]
MITVHHLNNSRSTRVLWLLEELGVPYEIKPYERGADLRAPASLRKVHPLGKSPVVTDDESGSTMAESGAILEYLLDRFDTESKFRPKSGTPERWQYNYWLQYPEASLMPQLLLALIFGMMEKQKLPFFVKPIVRKIVRTVKSKTYGPELQNHFEFIEAELAKRPYLAGQSFSAADIQMSYPLEAGGGRTDALEGKPKISGYLARLRERPAYARAIERGGPVAL